VEELQALLENPDPENIDKAVELLNRILCECGTEQL